MVFIRFLLSAQIIRNVIYAYRHIFAETITYNVIKYSHANYYHPELTEKTSITDINTENLFSDGCRLLTNVSYLLLFLTLPFTLFPLSIKPQNSRECIVCPHSLLHLILVHWIILISIIVALLVWTACKHGINTFMLS